MVPMMRVVDKQIGEIPAHVLRRSFAPHWTVRTDGEGFAKIECLAVLRQKIADGHGVMGAIGRREAHSITT